MEPAQSYAHQIIMLMEQIVLVVQKGNIIMLHKLHALHVHMVVQRALVVQIALPVLLDTLLMELIYYFIKILLDCLPIDLCHWVIL